MKSINYPWFNGPEFWLGSVIGLLLWLGFPAPVAGVVWEPLSIETLTRKAELVVQGKVLGKRCQTDEAGRIFTQVELQVVEVWKGTLAGNSLKVVHGGGRVGNRETTVSGQVCYEVGEEVVAFLVRNPLGQAVTIGLAQGKFNITRESSASEPMAHNLFHGCASQAEPSNLRLSQVAAAPLTLAELKRQVKGGRE